MKILVISTPVFQVPLSGYGGLEIIAWQTADGLAKLGHNVSLVAPEGSTCPNVTVIPNGKAGTWDEKRAFQSYHSHLNQFDVIIDHTWMKYSYMPKIEGKIKTPILGILHAPVNTMYQSLPPVEKPCMVCISQDQANHFEAIFSRPVRWSYNGIDLNFYKNINLKKSDRYLFLARFSTIKGPHIAINSCKKNKCGLDLIGDTSITGEPEYLKNCINAIQDAPYIKFVGPAKRGECVWWFSQAKALLHPNKLFREPFGLAPIEAMACGIPVVTWNYGAMRETVIQNETGYLVTSEEEFDEIVKENRVDSIRPEACVQQAQKFSVENMVKNYEKLCQEAIESGW